MLKVALTTSANHYDFYLKAANAVETTQVKALLMVLADTEGELMERIRLMMTTGILDQIEEVASESFSTVDPNPTPFGMDRTPFAVSNPAPLHLRENRSPQPVAQFKGFSFFSSISSRAKSELMKRLYEYFAHIKAEQIEKIRKVCETF